MTDHQHTADVLNRAADLIQERGWTYGKGGEPAIEGPLCMEGAIAAAVGAEHHTDLWGGRCPAYTAVRDYLDTAPYAWNDELIFTLIREERPCGVAALEAFRPIAANRARQQVVATLRAAAVIEQARADEHTAGAASEARATIEAMGWALVEFR